MKDINIHEWQRKYLKENKLNKRIPDDTYIGDDTWYDEGSQTTLADYFSNREGAVKRASKVVDELITKAGIDPNTQNQLVDAIIDLVDEIESNSNDSYEY